MTRGSSSRKHEQIVDCIRRIGWREFDYVEVAIYGSLIRGDFVGCISDIDVFIVSNKPIGKEEAKTIEEKIRRCAEAHELCYRDVDIAWCTLDEIQEGKCRFKFLTVYRGDFESNHEVVYGEPVHRSAPSHWDPCQRYMRLKEMYRRAASMKFKLIVLGELIKLSLMLVGYHGPWDKRSIHTMLGKLGWRREALIWRNYLSGVEPSNRIVERVFEDIQRFLGEKCRD
ncbi:MAG: nucleotidyltransferase domain-containing protein [Desulfurococcales archaeon]|nr:nucleotidyltransferase domain-containing protein [Desulfurococcales archaeon]